MEHQHMTQLQPDADDFVGTRNTFTGVFIIKHLILCGKKLFRIDLRTLALFRIMLATSCIAQLVTFWPDIFPLFDDGGVFPRRDARAVIPFYSWSLYFISGNVVWAHILFILTLFSSLALLVGYRSRAATVINWVLIGSLWTRASIFSNGSQMQLTLLSFWVMFLPLSARFSIDAALNKQPRGSNSYFSWATLAILLQEMYMYLCSALEKTGSAWQISRDAIYYVTHSIEITSPLASLLGPQIELERLLTIYVYHLELFAVIFLFSPIKTAWMRMAILPLLISMHIGFGLFLSIGIFPLVSIAGLTVFVPGLFWDKLLPRWNRSRQGITLYYDQDCEFCRKTCLILRELALPPETHIIPAQQVPEIYTLLQRANSWVVEDKNGTRYTRWDAVAWIWRRSPILWPLGVLFLPRFMWWPGDCVYAFIARHRAGFGKLSSHLLCESDIPLVFNLHAITRWFIACLTATIMVWNIGTLHERTLGTWSGPIDALLSVLKLAPQHWVFFAPDAPRVSIWVVIEGTLTSGGTVDVFNNRITQPRYERPKNGYDAFRSNYWLYFFGHTHYKNTWNTIGSYYCSAWNEAHPDMPVSELTLMTYRQLTPPPLVETVPEVQETRKLLYGCPLPAAGTPNQGF